MSILVTKAPPSKINLGVLKKKKVHLAIFGKGNVGGALINQIVERKNELVSRRDINLSIFCITDSKNMILNEEISTNWETTFENEKSTYSIEEVVEYVKENNLENVIAIDNTASREFVESYPVLIKSGFHLISSNKIANTNSLGFYKEIRSLLDQYEKDYLYETNVGAGLPLIDTIKLLHLSGENITRIRGVFSGSLSYIFNEFSKSTNSFSDIILKAVKKGYTEPDPREDLSGNDVARKLLILARELDLHNEIEDVEIHNLVPKDLRNVSKKSFFDRIKTLNVPLEIRKKNVLKDEVLRYVADLRGDLMKEDGAILTVKLETVKKQSVLGQLTGSDTLFEIYTDTYGDNPIVIQGAGAGAQVTARGVFGDILRLCDKIN